jgi:hypothetical protein
MAKWPCISLGAPKSESRFDFIFTLTRINDLLLLVEGGGRREKASVKGKVIIKPTHLKINF